MTLMLASVTSPAEALAATAAGADIIDFKDPSRGALGALPVPVVAEAVRVLAGRWPSSATVGDLPSDAALVAAAAREMAASGVSLVKIGLFDEHAPHAFVRALAGQSLGLTRRVLVLFADRSPDFSVLPEAAAAGFCVAMLDTADKHADGLRGCLGDTTLAEFVDRAHAAGLAAGLAGSLSLTDIAPLLPLAPDLLGFRTALCHDGLRSGAIDAAAVAAVRARIPAASGATALFGAPPTARIA